MRKFLTLCAFSILAGIVLTTCDSPNALGSQVPLPTPSPVINIIVTEDYGKGPGAFISGTETIYVEATVKQGIKSVTATYTYYVLDDDGKLIEKTRENINVPFDPETGLYTLDVDTMNPLGEDPPVPMADGALKVVVTAVDNAGNTTTTPELVYTVKNNPSLISLQIPKARPVNVDKVIQYNKHELENAVPPLVVTDNYIMGVFEDLAGVRRGYPQIKLWKEGASEPSDYKANAGWAGVTSNTFDAGGGWLFVDEGKVQSDSDDTGDKGGSFRYYLRYRDSDGNPKEAEVGNGLEPGFYRLKLRAQDIHGKPVEWPKDAYSNDPEFLRVELTTELTPPLVYIYHPDEKEIYQRGDFTIEAEAVVQGDMDKYITEMEFTVTSKDRKQVLLKRLTGSSTGSGAMSGDFKVEAGKTYYCMSIGSEAVKIDDVNDVPQDAYSYIKFENGNYNFTVRAIGDSGSSGTKSLTVYIDDVPPVTNVTSINPFYSQDRINETATEDAPNNNTHDYGTADSYRRWTVNKTVQINVSLFDAQGSAVDEDTGYTQLKYFFLKNEDVKEEYYTVWKSKEVNIGKSFGEYLFAREDAEYFDKVIDNPIAVPSGDNGHPLINIEPKDGAYILTLQTHKRDAAAADTPYKLWFYIVAMDNAGNIGYSKILLNVDQDTDKPKIESQNIENAFMGENYSIELAVRDDNKLSTTSISYRFAKNDEEKNDLNDLDDDDNVPDQDKGWKTLTAISLSVDELSISTKDFNLQKITADHSAGLGKESDAKYIQIRVVDDASNKIYSDTDGKETKTSEWLKFAIDLTYPEIVLITAPEKDHVYTDSFDFVRGDLKEANLKT
ncbi:MAG: hypothetical protein LBI04_01970, partial [Treponema sp.]|nr:hypothetical protein [Treponema sp.]